MVATKRPKLLPEELPPRAFTVQIQLAGHVADTVQFETRKEAAAYARSFGVPARSLSELMKWQKYTALG